MPVKSRSRKGKTVVMNAPEKTAERGETQLYQTIRSREKNMDCYRGKSKGGSEMPYNSKIIGLVIGTERVRRGMTQEQLSGLAGISRSHLAVLESGQKSLKVETLWKIAEALSIKPSKLLMMAEKKIEKKDADTEY